MSRVALYTVYILNYNWYFRSSFDISGKFLWTRRGHLHAVFLIVENKVTIISWKQIQSISKLKQFLIVFSVTVLNEKVIQ